MISSSESYFTQKEAFVVQLAKHSDAGRFHSQDAVLQPRTKDPHAMLTLPEFIREPMPRPEDAQAMLTLPGDDLPPPHPQDIYIHRPTSASEKAKKKLRNRSSSAPSLSWLRSSSSRSGSSSGSNLGFSTSQSRPRSRGQNMVPNSENFINIITYVLTISLSLRSGIRRALRSRNPRKPTSRACVLDADRRHTWCRCRGGSCVVAPR